jgi:biotin carboxyl carrier protein
MTLWIDIAGRLRKVELPTAPGTGQLTCLLDGNPITIDARTLTPGLISLVIPGAATQYRCLLDPTPEGDAVLINGHRIPFTLDDPRSLRARRAASTGADGPRPIKAPMPGRVIRLLASPGDEVAAHQGLIVIEAMKMQNELKSPRAGRVARISAQVGDTVQSGEVLIVIE